MFPRLVARKEGTLARVDPIPDFNPPPGDDTPDTGNETELFTTGYEQDLQISYYLYDHLGNTRIVFHTKLDCAGEIDYVAEYVADYYPFGKILREWAACDVERYLTTYHERDKESGYDYRGARLYDSDLGRFLSTDPLAAEYAMWSTYNYTFANPVMYIDPDGKNGIRIIDRENKTITVQATYHVVTRSLARKNSRGKLRYLKTYDPKDLARMEKKINRQINRQSKKHQISSGEFEGFTVNFQLSFVDGGTSAEAKAAANEDTVDGHSVGNTLELAQPGDSRFRKTEVTNADGTVSKIGRGGVTFDNKSILMNPGDDSLVNRIHEIFHTFGMSHPKGVGANSGVMAYPPASLTNDDIDFVGDGGNGLLPEKK